MYSWPPPQNTLLYDKGVPPLAKLVVPNEAVELLTHAERVCSFQYIVDKVCGTRLREGWQGYRYGTQRAFSGAVLRTSVSSGISKTFDE